MAIIQLKNVSVYFDAHEVVRAISLDVQAGESVVLIGPSGQGKTTILKSMAGLISPQKGEVVVAQTNLLTSGVKDREALMKRMGMLFQKNALFDSFTCGENIAFPLRQTTSLSEQEIAEKVDFFLDAVGIAHAKELFPDEISGGMQKRLGIARALALDPEIVFYDDPTAGLDPITSKKIIELIMELKRKRNSTIVAITNDMNRAYQLADTIYLVVNGELIKTGTPEETKRHTDPRVHQFVRGLTQGPLSTVGSEL
ncbi:MAG: ABC transporter ATP-binding protein [Bdellovibrionia bacterium]